LMAKIDAASLHLLCCRVIFSTKRLIFTVKLLISSKTSLWAFFSLQDTARSEVNYRYQYCHWSKYVKNQR
jgi:hypothetical protein